MSLTIPTRRIDGLDLKWVLVRRIVLVAMLCMIGGAILVLRDVTREATSQNEEAATTVAKQLSLQLTRIDAALDRPDRFPDWDAVVSYALSPGQCIQYVPSGNDAPRSNCQGIDAHGSISTDWFVRAYETILGSPVVVRPLVHGRTAKGSVIATIEPRALADRAWLELSRLIGIGSAMILAMCLLIYVVIERSLRPTTAILSGLNRLADGDLTHRLPRFSMRELDRIAEVFNGMAQTLETTTNERSELARKLVNAQEQERQHIARELHDDVAQRLSAMSGLATSIKRACQKVTPSAARQSEELVEIAAGTMRSLRDTLTQLRPPEIDDLGLLPSVQSLVEAHNRQVGGKTTFSLVTSGSFDGFPAETSAHIYRIIQEGLNNAARHANAKHVEVAMTNTQNEKANGWNIELIVRDDGSNEPSSLLGQLSGLGLIGVRERVYALAGTFSAGQRQPNGFELRVSFPVDQRTPKAA